jgi:hypothetical protein
LLLAHHGTAIMAQLTLVYTILAVLSVGFLVSRAFLKTPAYKKKSFPVLGPLEIAFTTHALSSNGILRRIAYAVPLDLPIASQHSM